MNSHYTIINKKLDTIIADLEKIKDRVGINDKATVINVQKDKEGHVLRVELVGSPDNKEIDSLLEKLGKIHQWWR